MNTVTNEQISSALNEYCVPDGDSWLFKFPGLEESA